MMGGGGGGRTGMTWNQLIRMFQCAKGGTEGDVALECYGVCHVDA